MESQASLVRVHVVDDVELWHSFVHMCLDKERNLHGIGIAADGLDAVRKAEELRLDLILLDISLPKLNGLNAARQIRKVAPKSTILFRRASRKAIDSARRLVMVLLPARAVSGTLFHLSPQLTSLAKSWATRELREAISHEVNRNGERSGLEGRCRTHDDHILDGICGTFHDVTVSFASCDIRVRGLRCTCWASRYWRLLIGAKNENLTLAQLDPDRACHRDSVGHSAGRDWKARADRESLPINSAIL